MTDARAGEVEMVVESVRVHMLSDRHVVILKDAGRDRYLPIWIGRWEASAIAAQLQGHVPDRPMTHDLFATVLGEAALHVDRIVISALQTDTFIARLVLVVGGVEHDIDARPSDAIALALRLGTTIFASAAVLDTAALTAADTAGAPSAAAWLSRSPTGPPGSIPPGAPQLEATGEPVDLRRLELFRDFVNSLGGESDPRGNPDQTG